MYYDLYGYPGIIGMLSINANNIYPISEEEVNDLIDKNYIPIVIQDAVFPVKMTCIGKRQVEDARGIIKSQLIGQIITIKSLDHYRYMRDDLSQSMGRYCKIILNQALNVEAIKDMKYEDIIPRYLMEKFEKFK